MYQKLSNICICSFIIHLQSFYLLVYDVSSSILDGSGNEDNNKESKQHDYNDEKSDKVGEEKQEQKTAEITTINQVF